MAGSQRQEGVALVLVLALLSGSLMLGLAGMSSSLVNERLAGNFRAGIIAHNEAEAGLYGFNSELREAIRALNRGESATPPVFASSSNFLADLRDSAEKARDADSWEESLEALDDALPGPPGSWSGWQGLSTGGRYHWRILPTLPADDTALAGALGLRIESEGFYGYSQGDEGIVRTASALLILPELPTGGRRGLMSCESIRLKGSGMIDSYDSRLGSYGGSNSRRSNVDVASQTEDSEIKVEGSAPIYGNVAASGRFTAEGSGEVYGSVQAYDTISLVSGGVDIYGNTTGMGDIVFQSSGTIHGDVHSGRLLHFKNYSAQINGNARAPLVLSDNRAPDAHVSGGLTIGAEPPDADSFGFRPKSSTEECSVHGRYTAYAPYLSNNVGEYVGPLIFGGGGRTITIGQRGDGQLSLDDPNGTPRPIGAEPETGPFIVRADKLDLGGSAELQVGEVGKPIDLVLVVSGDVEVGGGSAFRIAEGSSVTLVTSGRVNFPSGVVIGDSKPTRTLPDGTVKPVLSIVSSYNDGGGAAGVRISGASNVYGQIIAPNSEVFIGGSGGFFGEVSARSIFVDGSGGFHYDEAFDDMDDGIVDDGEIELPELKAIWVG
ncbi:DUF7305 domain-containing protein [Billgrantia saliphila]|uniref:DUF7305 domain-containing protein n=1 Tax=Billgrantia saliphila TaxID=1848458 RepID=UPI000CE3DF59|nr:polymer-forming cytoskeletal protein [Halomonas saliphila]